MGTAARLVRPARDKACTQRAERNMRSPPGPHTREYEPEGSKGCFYRSGISFETHRTEGR